MEQEPYWEDFNMDDYDFKDKEQDYTIGTATFIHGTEKAIKVEFTHEETGREMKIWMPKGQIHEPPAHQLEGLKKGDEVYLVVSGWIAEKKDLI